MSDENENTDLQARARAEKERRERGLRDDAGATMIFYDADDPEEPARTIREDTTPGPTFAVPEEQDEEELAAGGFDFDENPQGSPPKRPN
jgi:hypothetical protein